MPFALSPNLEGEFLSVQATGEIIAAELLQLHSDLASETAHWNRCLLNFAESDVSKLTGPIVRQLASLPPRFERLAIVGTPGMAFGLGKMYQSAAQRGRAIGVFTSEENAVRWLTRGQRTEGQ